MSATLLRRCCCHRHGVSTNGSHRVGTEGLGRHELKQDREQHERHGGHVTVPLPAHASSPLLQGTQRVGLRRKGFGQGGRLGELPGQLVPGHGVSLDTSERRSDSRRAASARDARDFTVPRLTPRVCAISSSLSPS